MINKLILSAAITGTWPTKEMNPSVPITAAEIGEEADRVVRAAVIHIHVRDDEGKGTMDTAKFEEAYSQQPYYVMQPDRAYAPA